MNFFDYWWIPFVVFGGLGLGGWGMWLEHQRKQKALDVLRDAIASGKEVPEPLVNALTQDASDPWGMGGGFGGGGSPGGWPGVAFFAILSAGFAAAAWFGEGRQANAFWLVAAITAAMAVMTLVVHLTSRSRR